MKSPFLSKSKYLIGLQCPKLLWYNYNAKDKLPPLDAATQAVFEQGREVGRLAQSLFPGGIAVGEEPQFDKVIARTKALIEKRKPLFEAGLLYENTYARADILNPLAGRKWDIIEVKSSGSVKEVHYQDVAFQRYCFEGAGLEISRCCLMYINKEYVRHGDVDPRELFLREDITKESKQYGADIKKRLSEMCDIIASKKCPDAEIGPHCDDPYGCPLKSDCWKFLPEDNIFTLYYLKQDEAFKFLKNGVLHINDIPENAGLNFRQQIQRECLKSGRAHVDKKGIKAFLDSLEYPLYLLDFETFNNAIPPYDNSMPFRHIPFQFSLHVWEKPDSKPVHHSYLADGREDPRPEILSQLKKLMGKKGTVIAYNMSFEISRLKECAEVYPEYQEWLDGVLARFTDLLTPFRAFHYYHPSQKGSASIKRIVPPLTDKSYEDMDIVDGGSASSEYVRVTFGNALGTERKRIYDALLKYCELDTQVMIDIIKGLKKLVG